MNEKAALPKLHRHADGQLRSVAGDFNGETSVATIIEDIPTLLLALEATSV